MDASGLASISLWNAQKDSAALGRIHCKPSALLLTQLILCSAVSA